MTTDIKKRFADLDAISKSGTVSSQPISDSVFDKIADALSEAGQEDGVTARDIANVLIGFTIESAEEAGIKPQELMRIIEQKVIAHTDKNARNDRTEAHAFFTDESYPAWNNKDLT